MAKLSEKANNVTCSVLPVSTGRGFTFQFIRLKSRAEAVRLKDVHSLSAPATMLSLFKYMPQSSHMHMVPAVMPALSMHVVSVAMLH